MTYWEGSSTSTNSLLEDNIGGFRALQGLEILERGGNVLVLVPPRRDAAADDGTVAAFGAVDDAAQLIEGCDSDLIEVTVSEGRSLSILERFLRAITLQAEARGKAVWVR